MPTITIYPTVDGRARCSDATYATARAGNGTLLSGTGEISDQLGQGNNGTVFDVYQQWLVFDTSVLAGLNITSAILSLFNSAGDTEIVTDFTVEARLGVLANEATVADGDFVAGDSLAGETLLATLATSGHASNAYNAFSDVAMVANLNTAGNTVIHLFSSRTRTNNAPGVSENEFFGSYFVTRAGTDNDPKLVITYTLPAAAGGGRPARPSSTRSYGYGYGY